MVKILLVSLHVIDNTTSGQDITCIISVIDNTTSGQDITCIISVMTIILLDIILLVVKILLVSLHVIDNTTSGQDITCIISVIDNTTSGQVSLLL